MKIKRALRTVEKAETNTTGRQKKRDIYTEAAKKLGPANADAVIGYFADADASADTDKQRLCIILQRLYQYHGKAQIPKFLLGAALDKSLSTNVRVSAAGALGGCHVTLSLSAIERLYAVQALRADALYCLMNFDDGEDNIERHAFAARAITEDDLSEEQLIPALCALCPEQITEQELHMLQALYAREDIPDAHFTLLSLLAYCPPNDTLGDFFKEAYSRETSERNKLIAICGLYQSGEAKEAGDVLRQFLRMCDEKVKAGTLEPDDLDYLIRRLQILRKTHRSKTIADAHIALRAMSPLNLRVPSGIGLIGLIEAALMLGLIAFFLIIKSDNFVPVGVVCFIVLALPGVFLFIYPFIWSVRVQFNQMEVRRPLRLRRMIAFDDISVVREKMPGIIVYCGKKRALDVDRFVDGYGQLCEQLSDAGKFDTQRETNQFFMRQPAINRVLTAAGTLLFGACAAISLPKFKTGAVWLEFVMFAVAFAFSAYYLLQALRWRIRVEYNAIYIRKALGIEHCYTPNEITGMAHKQGYVLLMSGNKKIAKVPLNATNFPMLMKTIHENALSAEVEIPIDVEE